MRCYDVSQLSMKFDRHLDAEIVDFQLLSDDYSKAVFLCADRSLCFHARFGAYYKMRVPRFGRDLAYCPGSAELLVVGSAPEVYRLSLAEGRFLAPLQASSPAINACGVAPSHGLLACAGEDGWLECFDPRQRTALGRLDAAGSAGAARADGAAL
jgi:ribosome biogenesis protein ENP2